MIFVSAFASLILRGCDNTAVCSRHHDIVASTYNLFESVHICICSPEIA